MRTRVLIPLAAVAGILGGVGATLIGGSASAASGPVFTPSSFYLVYDFVKVGDTSPSQSVTVTNTGSGDETFSAVSLKGLDPGDFVIDSDSCSGQTLHTNDSCDVSVKFTPAAKGTRIASLRFDDNTPCGNIVDLAGSGTDTTTRARAHTSACIVGKVVTNTVTTTTTTPGSGGGGGGGTTTTVTNTTTQTKTVATAPSGNPPRNCKSVRLFNTHVFAPKGKTFKALSATIAKRKLKVTLGMRRSAIRIDLRGLKHARFALHVRGTLSPRGKFSLTKHYVTCTSRARS